MNNRAISLYLSVLILFSHVPHSQAAGAVLQAAEAGAVLIAAARTLAGAGATVAGYAGLKQLENTVSGSPSQEALPVDHDALIALKEAPPVIGFGTSLESLSHKDQYLIAVRENYRRDNQGLSQCTFEEYVKKHPYNPNANILNAAAPTTNTVSQLQPKPAAVTPAQTAQQPLAAPAQTAPINAPTTHVVAQQSAPAIPTSISTQAQTTQLKLGSLTNTRPGSITVGQTTAPFTARTTAILGTDAPVAQSINRVLDKAAPATVLKETAWPATLRITKDLKPIGIMDNIKNAASKAAASQAKKTVLIPALQSGQTITLALSPESVAKLLAEEVIKPKTVAQLSFWRRWLQQGGTYLAKSSNVVKEVIAKGGEVLKPVVEKVTPYVPYIGIAIQVYELYSLRQTINQQGQVINELKGINEKLKARPKQEKDPKNASEQPEDPDDKDKGGKLGKLACAKAVDDTKKKIEWSWNQNKHKSPSNMSWKDVVEHTKHGHAKYKPDINIEKLERLAWEQGTPVNIDRDWKVIELDRIIGAKSGLETKYMRIEMNTNTIHGHPITPQEFARYTKLVK